MNNVERIVSILLDGQEPCPHCHPQLTGRRAELKKLGWRRQGWQTNAEFVSPSGYFVTDRVIDTLPEEEWQSILAKTNVPRPNHADSAGMPPKADIMPGGSLGTVGGNSGSTASGMGGGL